MTSPPTPADAADHIITVFAGLDQRPGDVLRIRNLAQAFAQPGWRGSDFNLGIEFALQQNWVALVSTTSFRLTEAGYQRFTGSTEMNFASKCNEKITLERTDGTRYEDVRVLVTEKMVLVPDASIPISNDDVILRPLPSGIVERLVVTSPGFFAQSVGFPPHYQVRYRHEGKRKEGSPGYVIHASNNSHVNINAIDNSINNANSGNHDLALLASELATLRDALVKTANSPEHYVAIGSISSAELAAKSGSKSNVSKALSALGDSGKWVLGAAKEIGVSLASEAIKSYVGLPPG